MCELQYYPMLKPLDPAISDYFLLQKLTAKALVRGTCVTFSRNNDEPFIKLYENGKKALTDREVVCGAVCANPLTIGRVLNIGVDFTDFAVWNGLTVIPNGFLDVSTLYLLDPMSCIAKYEDREWNVNLIRPCVQLTYADIRNKIRLTTLF